MRSALVLILALGCHGNELRNPPANQLSPKPASASAAATAKVTLGDLDFPVTGSPECQRKFREGMLQWHSFLYPQAHETFTAAFAAGNCPMALWGDAMTYDHPIWKEQDTIKARAVLAKITNEETLSPKERGYIAAVRALYGNSDVKLGRIAWLEVAAAMHKSYPDDDEVALQHVLALLAVYGYDPTHVREQMEAGGMALAVLQRRPNHPGAAHYVIHAFDSRDHAILALPAALTYARIAPAAGHAQHMPSHTFAHLGMWREVVPSNENATAAAIAWSKSHGESPSLYDWHAYSWLVAARLELGQFAKAKELVDASRAYLVAATDDSGDFRYDYSNMVAIYVTQTDRWSELEELVAPLLTPVPLEGTGGHGPVACAMHAPGGTGQVRTPTALMARMNVHVLRAEAAIRAGDRATVEKRVADLHATRAQAAAWVAIMPPDYTKAWDATEEALLGRAVKAKAKQALERLMVVRDAQQSVGPTWQKTPRELLGDLLLELKQPKEALAAFERDLEDHPNHAVALLGAARAATAMNDATGARKHYAVLADLWRDADANVGALAEVRAASN